MRPITHIVVHHSGLPYGTPEGIRRYHVRHNGWDDIGYHYTIANGIPSPTSARDSDFDGLVEVGRPFEISGAHEPLRNRDSIGICLIGDGRFTKRQHASLIALCADLCLRFNIPVKNILGHREADAPEDRRECPGLNEAQLRADVATLLTMVSRGLGEKG